MDKEVLLQLLARATETKSSARCFSFGEKQRGVVLIAAGVEAMPVEPVERVEVEDSYAVLSTARGETYLVPFERIVAISYRRTEDAGAGAGFKQ